MGYRARKFQRRAMFSKGTPPIWGGRVSLFISRKAKGSHLSRDQMSPYLPLNSENVLLFTIIGLILIKPRQARRGTTAFPPLSSRSSLPQATVGQSCCKSRGVCPSLGRCHVTAKCQEPGNLMQTYHHTGLCIFIQPRECKTPNQEAWRCLARIGSARKSVEENPPLVDKHGYY
jgi:hypothetical protein